MLNFPESIVMEIKRDEDKIDLVTICQLLCTSISYNSVMLDKLELEDLIELLNTINEAVL